MFTAFMLGLGLVACAADPEVQTEQPGFYVTLAATRVEVNAKTAASMISSFRRSHGLGAVTIDQDLTRFAQAHARAMAAHNMLGHDVGARFAERRRTIRARVVVENVAAGYYSVAEVFAGWRDSPGHRANMLDPDMTRMGIAAAHAPGSSYQVFWALVLASPSRR
jgi:uncharacterized protein YkwD